MKNHTLPLITLALLIAGCQSPSQNTEAITATAREDLGSNDNIAKNGVLANRDMNKHPMAKTICQPWSSQPIKEPSQGIRATLAYRRPAIDPRWYKSQDYLRLGERATQTFFLKDLNVPTRLFQQGFLNQLGQPLTDLFGQRLIEYFGLEFNTQLRLTPKDTGAQYDLALLADDGVTLSTAIAGNAVNLIVDEGDHPTKMSCTNEPITLSRDKALPIRLTYYQGPRYHIALTLLWREHNPNKDPLCGRSGNSLFFDPDRESKPQTAYQQLLSRGWQPIPAQNFILPAEEDFNPCTEGPPVLVSEFLVSEIAMEQVQVSWQTDQPATSQVKIENLSTGQITVTPSDQRLRTQHELTLTGLQPGTEYKLQAISITEQNGQGVSASITVKTLD